VSQSHRANFVESLEARQFLAADISLLAASTAAGKSANITIKNTGTVTMSGPVTVTVTAKPAAGGAAQTVATKTVTLSGLKKNASKGFSGITLKSPTGTGKFNFTVKIAKADDSNLANNTKAAGSFTVKGTGGNNGGGTTGDGEAVFGSALVGTKLKFKKTGTLPGHGVMGFVNETGTFTDDKGNSGTYQLTLPPTQFSSTQPPQLLNLDFKKPGIQRQYMLTFTPVSKRPAGGLNGKTVTFSTKPAGSSAKGLITSTFLPTVYLKY
jgi:hypothetical protein